MKKAIIILLTIVVVLVVGFFGARYYAYNFGKRDVRAEQAAFTVKTTDLVAEFIANEVAANKKYLEKPVAISGTITSINATEVIIDEVGVCNFTEADTSLKIGQNATIKGRVVGYDDLLGGVNLDQCSIHKK